MNDITIYIVDDDLQVRTSFTQMLELEGYKVTAFSSANACLHDNPLNKEQKVVVISDIRMPDVSGLELLDEVQRIDAEIPFILITGHADVDMAIDGMKRGAFDFIQKPVKPEHILNIIQKAAQQRFLIIENRRLKQQINQQLNNKSKLIGTHPLTQQLRAQISNLATTNVDVLINGETGSGKEVVARELHAQSQRHNAPFVALNCGAIPHDLIESELFGHEKGAFTNANKQRIGKIESANHGTLFLDEIESMPSSVQIKLLRVLQERSIQRLGSNKTLQLDFTVLAASKVDLHQASNKGEFRADLLYRLDVASIHIPPLRERGDDALLLFNVFAEQAAKKYNRVCQVTPPLLQAKLLHYAWPGNVRECQNLAEKWVLDVQDPRLNAEDCEHNALNSLDDKLDCFERQLLLQTLENNDWKISQTAEVLKIPRKRLYLRMKKHGVERGELG